MFLEFSAPSAGQMFHLMTHVFFQMPDGKNQHLVLFKENLFDVSNYLHPLRAGGDTGPKEHVETSVAAVAEMLCAAKVSWPRSTHEIVCGHGPRHVSTGSKKSRQKPTRDEDDRHLW